MRVIITGASGFIGKNFLLSCPKEWDIYAVYHQSDNFNHFLKEYGLFNVKAIRCDLMDIGETREMAKVIGEDIDLALYFAAKVDIPNSVQNPLDDLNYNTVALLNFLESFKSDKFIFMSSGAVYEGLKGEVCPGIPLNPKLPYAISKLASEQYVKFYHENRHRIGGYVIIRFYGAYGPFEPAHKIYTKLLQALYFQEQKKFEIYGDGKNLINAMYIDDAIEGLFKIIQSSVVNETVDFLGIEPIKVEELVERVGEILGLKNILVKKNGVCHEYIEFYSNTSDMQRKFGYLPHTTLNAGMQEFLSFLKKGQG